MIAAILFAILFAIYCATDDAYEIRTEEEIHHGLQWAIRFGCVLIFLVLWLLVWDTSALRIAIGGICMGAAFSMVFRFTLNKLRKRDWRYVGPSNWYDYAFLMATGAWGWMPKKWTWRRWKAFMEHCHWNNYELNPPYVEQVHRAGLLAYIVEAVVLALSMAGYYLLVSD